MSRYVIGSGLKALAAVISRTSAVALVVLGLAPPAAAQQSQPARHSVGERIERVRTALHERGPDTLGSLARVLPAAEEDSDQKKKKKKPPDWDDWNDWNDWSDF